MKANIVLKALSVGMPVKFPDGQTYHLVQDVNGKDLLCFEATRYRFSSGEAELFFSAADHVSFSYFLNQCGQMSDDDIHILAAETVLNERQKASRERRERQTSV